MRVLITGAGGFVGGHLIPELAAAGHEIVAASHGPVPAAGEAAVETFDLRDAAACEEVVERHLPGGLVHLAAQASVPQSWEDPAGTYGVNVTGTANLLHALRDRPGCRVLLAGSAHVYGSVTGGRPVRESDPCTPSSPYALSKLAQEQMGLLYHRELGLQALATRSFNHTGPGQSTEYAVGAFCSKIAAIERGDMPPRMEVGNLDARRDFCDVRDVVIAYRLLLEKGAPGDVYNVASGVALRIGDLLKILLDAAGMASSVEVVETAPPRPGDPDSLVGDVSKILAAVGWQPRIPIEQSLVDTLDWYRRGRHGPAGPN